MRSRQRKPLRFDGLPNGCAPVAAALWHPSILPLRRDYPQWNAVRRRPCLRVGWRRPVDPISSWLSVPSVQVGPSARLCMCRPAACRRLLVAASEKGGPLPVLCCAVQGTLASGRCRAVSTMRDPYQLSS